MMRMITDQMHRTILVPEHPQRILSLVPSQTELLYDLGLGVRVVGITRFCIHPEEWFRSKARVGGTKQVDLDKVRALHPDLIIGNKEENTQADIEALGREFPVWMSDVKDLDSALDMIARIGVLTGTTAQATTITAEIRTAFQCIEPVSPTLSAVYLIWQQPWMLAGEDTFIHDMLLHCGFTMPSGLKSRRYPEVSDAELAALDPDIVLLSSEPFPFQEKHIAAVNMILPGTPVHLVDGEMFSWYGGRLRKAPAYFRQLMARSVR